MISSIQDINWTPLEDKWEELEKDIYNRGDDFSVLDLDNHDIYSSENELNSIENY